MSQLLYQSIPCLGCSAVNTHRGSKEVEGAVSNVWDGFSIEREVGVIRLTTGSPNCQGHTLGDIGFHAGPHQPGLSGSNECPTR